MVGLVYIIYTHGTIVRSKFHLFGALLNAELDEVEMYQHRMVPEPTYVLPVIPIFCWDASDQKFKRVC